MKQLLNTLFVTSEDIYLSLDGENVVANRSGTAVARYPLHTLQSIVSFGLFRRFACPDGRVRSPEYRACLLPAKRPFSGAGFRHGAWKHPT